MLLHGIFFITQLEIVVTFQHEQTLLTLQS